MIRLLASAAAAALLTATPAMAQSHDHAAPAAHAAQAPCPGDFADVHAEFESGRFHVRLDGPENPIGDIILIPGLSSSPHAWDLITESLKGRYRVHRIHVQGFAGAEPMDNATGPVSAPVAEDLARYIAEKGLNKPAVIGHSMGGTIGMMLAARHPDSVGRLMVVDMIPFMGAAFGATSAAGAAPMADQMYAGMTSGPEEAYRAQAAASVTSMINTEALRAGPLRDTARSDRAVSASAFRELLVTDLTPELASITAPTTVLYVKFNDPRMTDAMVDGIYRASYRTLPGATLKRIDDSAHFIMLDQPARFEAEVNAFLGS